MWSNLYYDSTFVCEDIESKSVFIPKAILLFFQVLSYLRTCSSRRCQNIKKSFFQKFWKVSNVLWNSRPIRATTSKYIYSVACGMFQAIDVQGDYNFFRIQPGLRWPNFLRCGFSGCKIPFASSWQPAERHILFVVTFNEPVNFWSNPVSCNGPLCTCS